MWFWWPCLISSWCEAEWSIVACFIYHHGSSETSQIKFKHTTCCMALGVCCGCWQAPRCDENHLKLSADKIWIMLLYIRNQELFGMLQKFVLFIFISAPPAMSHICHLLLREQSNFDMSLFNVASLHLHHSNMTWSEHTWLLLKRRWDNGRSRLTQA